MRSNSINCVVLAVVLACTASALSADVSVVPLFRDHAVLQRGGKVPVWGTAAPGEEITVSIAGKEAATTADDKGNWKAELPELPVGGPYTLTIAGADGAPVSFSDVMVGDVWLCSGQSNMDWPVKAASNPEKEIAAATDDKIRLFQFEHTSKADPSHTVLGEWKVTSPQTIANFSAVGYFFGRELRKSRPNVPVGLIQCAWGGMPAESFTSREMLQTRPEFKPILERKAAALNVEANRAAYNAAAKQWQADVIEKDAQPVEQFAGADVDASGWETIDVPQSWEKTGKLDGAVWLRRDIEIPETLAGKELVLSLGPIDDYDDTYFNGERVGGIGIDNDRAFATPRQYTVPASLVKPGKNVIAVRVFDVTGPGGFTGKPEQMHLAPKDAPASGAVSLAGVWQMKVERAVDGDTLPPRPQPPISPDAPFLASNLFNGQILPIVPYAVTGAIWYQGESNASRAEQYRTLFPAMIEDWRKAWNKPAEEFPFLFVQLANFKAAKSEPGDSDWAELREAQLMTLEKSKNTGMAVIIDIGEAKDIHPKNKQDVGRRLALAAEHLAYGNKEIVYSGPTYRSMKIDGETIRIKFDHVGGGLKARSGEGVKGFAIAGEDQKFIWADARIDGDEVVVSSKDVKKPKALRYAWADNPDTANLINAEGLPASPFRTDDWPMTTAGKN